MIPDSKSRSWEQQKMRKEIDLTVMSKSMSRFFLFGQGIPRIDGVYNKGFEAVKKEILEDSNRFYKR